MTDNCTTTTTDAERDANDATLLAALVRGFAAGMAAALRPLEARIAALEQQVKGTKSQ